MVEMAHFCYVYLTTVKNNKLGAPSPLIESTLKNTRNRRLWEVLNVPQLSVSKQVQGSLMVTYARGNCRIRRTNAFRTSLTPHNTGAYPVPPIEPDYILSWYCVTYKPVYSYISFKHKTFIAHTYAFQCILFNRKFKNGCLVSPQPGSILEHCQYFRSLPPLQCALSQSHYPPPRYNPSPDFVTCSLP